MMQNHYSNDIHEKTRHQWRYILSRLGIPEKALLNQHQPCPLCGGNDRYRFDDQDGKGTYFCNQCGAGDGFTMAMKWLDCPFSEAVATIRHILGDNSDEAIATRAKMQIRTSNTFSRPSQNRLKPLLELWHKASPNLEPLQGYFQARGLSERVTSEAIRLTRLPYWIHTKTGEFKSIGEYPCMIAQITDANGHLQGIHQTYFNADGISKLNAKHPETGQTLPSKKMQSVQPKSTTGAAVRLAPIQNGGLIVAEGIETALASRELIEQGNSLGLYACLSANGLQSLAIEQGVETLIIMADNDQNQAGEKAAFALAKRAKQHGARVKMWQSNTLGFDALDELNALKN